MEIGPCDLFRVSFGIPLNPRLGRFFEGDSRAFGTTSNGSDRRPPPPQKKKDKEGARVYTGWPPKNGTVDTVAFSGLCSDQQFYFSPCWIERLFLIIIIPRSSNLVENFLFMSISYGLSFSRFARFPRVPRRARLMTE